MFGRIALTAAALVLAPAASAQDLRPIDETAADLAYGYCPLFLAKQFSLTDNPKLVEYGFTTPLVKTPHPRFGELQFVDQLRGDVEITFGGVPAQVCQVNVIGGDGAAILAKFKQGLGFLPYKFKPDPANTRTAPNGASAETFKTQLDDKTVLRVQFITGVVKGKPITGFQIFGMAQ